MSRIHVKSSAREELIDITEKVRALVRASGTSTGVACLWSLHTTCGLTVNEGADPDVRRDIVAFMKRIVPGRTPRSGTRKATPTPTSRRRSSGPA